MGEEDDNPYFGQDCPEGMVQIEFVGVSPELRRGEYGWKPSERAFLEVWVDGKRFRIDVGNVVRHDGSTRRGLHINFPLNAVVDKHSLNAADIFIETDEDKNEPDAA